MSLFDAAAANELERRGPLASRLRPRTLDEVIGQADLLAPGAALRSLIDKDRLSSVIFFGPPGTGKTTVARLAASSSKKSFVQLSAVSAGVKDVREFMDAARRRLGETGQGSVLFLDEIHRFSRSQQDALLPGVEEGLFVLIGATTENPFISLNSALLSRSTLYRFTLLSEDELKELSERALSLEGFTIDDDALHAVCQGAEGDGRAVLVTLEVAFAIASSRENATNTIDLATIAEAGSVRVVRHSDDDHYDMLSVFIKSLRGSDPDAALYWMCRLLAAGEDPRLISRRMTILASEDIGLADSNALLVADAAGNAVERIGMPEVALNLAHAAIYLAMAPKSNRTTTALGAAQEDVANVRLGAVPPQFRDGHYKGASALGHGVGYEYPHNDPRGVVAAVYLPDELAGRRYYEPSEHGREAQVAVRLKELRALMSTWNADDKPK